MSFFKRRTPTSEPPELARARQLGSSLPDRLIADIGSKTAARRHGSAVVWHAGGNQADAREQRDGESARILSTEALPDGGQSFQIDKSVRGRDLLATLRFFEPDAEARGNMVRTLLAFGASQDQPGELSDGEAEETLEHLVDQGAYATDRTYAEVRLDDNNEITAVTAEQVADEMLALTDKHYFGGDKS